MDEHRVGLSGRTVGRRGVGRARSARHGIAAVFATLAAGLLTATALVAFGPSQAAFAHASQSQLAHARNELLVLADMPAGWIKTKSTNSDTTVGNAQLARCLGVPEALVAENPPSVNSPQFQNHQGTLTVDDNVTVFPSTKNAAAELAVSSSSKMPSCLTQLASGPLKTKYFGKLPKNVSIGTPLVSPTAASAFGADTPGYSLSVPVTSHGVTVNITVTQFVAVKGVFGQQLTFTAVGTPFSIPLEQRITAAAVERL
jgi:hypothetical protein